MKKKIRYSLLIVAILLIIFAIVFCIRMQSVSKKEEVVSFIVASGTNKFKIVNNLADADIIQSRLVGYTFAIFQKNMQAGTYEIDKSDTTLEIIKQIGKGQTNVKAKTVTLTFVEGAKITDYAKVISENLDYSEEEVIDFINNEEFIKQVINDYSFVTEDILQSDIYYPLEGYLYPDTYEVYENASIKDVIYKMLDSLEKVVNEYEKEIKDSNYSLHELLTISSIAEKEALNYLDRTMVSQVIYKRLNIGMTLGMDVTSYYGVFKDMNDTLTGDDLADNNPYNTRSGYVKALPIGPICNPSKESIKASLYPSDTDYVYFIADVKTGKVYFAEDYNGFIELKNKYM